MLFPGNPFMVAIDRFAREAALRFHTVRSWMSMSTNGEVRYTLDSYLTEPPSPFGYMTCVFTYLQSDLDGIELERDELKAGASRAEGAAGVAVPDGVSLQVERIYHAPTVPGGEVDATAGRLLAIAQQLPLTPSPLSLVSVNVTAATFRRGMDLGGGTGGGVRHDIQVRLVDDLSLPDVLTLDWERLARDWHEQSVAFGEAVTGQRPEAADDLLAG
jgi:hypothetical protein